ncbi:hypothetical protein [Gracilimonas sp.]|uniref:hypothetical protein n=1 Tax=Gracilimonas sp. TaxID=1974203 RepID=UPI0028720B0E|nr:hypothetical protein [Gracilimonas sp.]
MRRFDTKEELVEWIETMHLQNTNGRETKKEMFRLGIEAAIEELTEFNLFSIPFVVGRSEQLKAFLAWLEKEGGSPFIDKDALIDDWLKSL